MPTPIVSIQNLTKTYASGLQALKPINLEINKGEIFALLGPNGAGKTTLINIVCGIVTPSSGKITVDGKDIQRDFRATRQIIGLVPQELATDMFERVGDTVNLSRGLFGRAAEREVHREAPARSFPVGQAQRQDHDAVGRHEAPRDDRQGLEPRAARAVPRRADGGGSMSSFAATCGSWCGACAITASPSS